MKRITECPYCGSDRWLYSKFTGLQLYNYDGNPCGYDTEYCGATETKSLWCYNCNRKVTTRDKMQTKEET